MKFGGRKSKNQIREIQREIDLLYKLNSPYLIKMLDHFEDENFEGPSYVYLVMEFIDGVTIVLVRKTFATPFLSLRFN